MNGKTFHINLERNDNKSESILCGNKSVCMNFPSPTTFLMDCLNISRMFCIYHIPLAKVLYFLWCTIKGRVMTLQMAFTCNRQSLKQILPILPWCTTYKSGSSEYSKKLSTETLITDKFIHPFVSCLLSHPSSFGSFSRSIYFLRKQHYMHPFNKLPVLCLNRLWRWTTSSVRFMEWWPFSVLNWSLLSLAWISSDYFESLLLPQ